MLHNKLGIPIIACSLSTQALGMLLTSICAADEYQSDVTFSHLSSESDDNVDISLTGLLGSYYLSPVSTTNKPLAEAAFLEHASSLSATLLGADVSGDARGDGQSWGIEYTHANKESPWLFTIGILKADLDLKSAFGKSSYESDSIFLGLGYFLDNSTLIGGEILNTNGSYSGAYSGDEDGKEYTLSLKKVTLLSPETAFNLLASFSKQEEEDDFDKQKGQTFALAGDYYLSPNTSIGASFSKRSHDDTDLEGETIGISLTSFVQSNLYLHAALEQFDADSGSDGDSWQIALGYRF